MSKHYFTFGSGHHDTHGRSLGRYYVEIEADDYSEARKQMFAHFGDKWGFQYDEAHFAGQPERFGLEPLFIEGVELCCGIEQIKFLEGHAKIHELLDENRRLKSLLAQHGEEL